MTRPGVPSSRALEPTVAGESAREILSIASRFELAERDDGTWHFEYEAPAEEVAPLRRALMRVEAELLVADAATIGTEAEEPRTPDQRRAPSSRARSCTRTAPR